jgi:galactonate dehydratase
MKIVDVRTVIVDGGFRNWVFVLIDSDDGLTGYGECTLEGREMAVAGAVQDFRRHLVGEEGDDIRHLRRRLSRHGYWESGPVISSGIGGVEMALWDLFAKSLGRPLVEVLGGAVRETIPVYSNAWYFGAASPSEFADCARRTVALGYKGLKFDPFEVVARRSGARRRRARRIVDGRRPRPLRRRVGAPGSRPFSTAERPFF